MHIRTFFVFGCIICFIIVVVVVVIVVSWIRSKNPNCSGYSTGEYLQFAV